MAEELESLRTRLGLDPTEYQEKWQDVINKTRLGAEQLKAHLEQTRLAMQKALAGGAMEAAAKVQLATNIMGTATDLLKGKFHTVGQAMQGVAGIAAAIPVIGPALSLVTGAAGGLVDFFDRHLIKAQERAREGFMSVARGARTAQQAMSSIRQAGVTEALEQIVTQIQTVIDLPAFVNRFGANIEAGSDLQRMLQGDPMEAAGRVLEQRVAQAERAANMLRQLLEDPRLRPGVERLAGEQMNSQLVQRAQMEGERRMHREVYQAVRQGDAEHVVQLQREMAIRRTIRQYFSDAQGNEMAGARQRAEGLITEQTMVQLRRAAAANIEHQHEQQMVQFREKHIKQMETLADKNTVLQAAQDGASKLEQAHLTNRLKIERELSELRRRGFSPEHIGVRREQLEREGAIELHNAALSAANEIINRNRTSEERRTDSMRQLNAVMDSGTMSQEQYNREAGRIERATQQYREWNSVVQQGLGIVQSFQGPERQFVEQLNAVEQAFRAGEATAEEYAMSVEMLTRRYQGLLETITPVQSVSSRSADAFQRITDASRMYFTVQRSQDTQAVIDEVTQQRAALEQTRQRNESFFGAVGGAGEGVSEVEFNERGRQDVINAMNIGGRAAGAVTGSTEAVQMAAQTAALEELVRYARDAATARDVGENADFGDLFQNWVRNLFGPADIS